MNIHNIASAVGLLALGIILTVGSTAFAQSSAVVGSAVITGASASDAGGGLPSVVPVVPVNDGNRHRHRDRHHWSGSHGGYNYYGGRYVPQYRYRPRDYRGNGYYCWSDGWQTYCGYY